MNKKSDQVFLIKGESLKSLPERTMRQGFFGKNLEDALQHLIERHPEVIPGEMIEPGSDDPPRFVLLRREMPVGGWSLDHLLVDQRGVLTLVEAKLAQNPESRRDVVGQIMEYAANAARRWTGGVVRETAEEFWADRGKNVDDVIRAGLDESIDIDKFWALIEGNLQRGKIRLIIAGDEIRPEVRRIIEYLNEEMMNAEVYGLELHCYGEDVESLVLVPRLIGQTQATADRKQGIRAASWGVDKLRPAYEQKENRALGARLLEVLEWSSSHGYFLETQSKGPSFGLRGKSGNRVASFFADGSIYIYINAANYPGGVLERNELVQGLKRINLLSPDFDPNSVVSGRNLPKKLFEISEGELEELLNILSEFCINQEVKT